MEGVHQPKDEGWEAQGGLDWPRLAVTTVGPVSSNTVLGRDPMLQGSTARGAGLFYPGKRGYMVM